MWRKRRAPVVGRERGGDVMTGVEQGNKKAGHS